MNGTNLEKKSGGRSMTFMLLKKYYDENRNRLLLSFGLMPIIMLLVFFFISLASYPISYSGYSATTDSMWRAETEMSIIFFLLFSTFAGSMMFSGLGSKEQRLGMLTLPAPEISKFMSRFLLFVPIFIIVFILSFMIADFGRFLIVKIFFNTSGWNVGMLPFQSFFIFDYMHVGIGSSYTPTASETAARVFSIYGMALLLISVYSFGSLLFPRMSFIKTSVALFIIVKIGSILFAITMAAGRFDDISLPEWVA